MADARLTLTKIRSLGDYASNFRWIIGFPSDMVSTLLGNVGGGSVADGTYNALCETTTIPFKQNAKMDVAIRGHHHFQPGITTVGGPIQMSFAETVNNHVTALLYGWQEAIWGQDRGIARSKYAFEGIQLSRLDSYDAIICVYTLEYVFMESFTPPNLDGTTSGPLTMSCTLSYDDYHVDMFSPSQQTQI